MKASISHIGWEGFLRYLLWIAGILYIAAYLGVVFYRISYPFELEWMEGCAIEYVRRILSGRLLYVRPSIDFVPFIYTPLYYYVSAAFAKVIGVGFTPLRLVSVISSLGCMYLVYLFVKRETSSGYSGFLSACLFAATYKKTEAWFDLARVDSLFLLLILSSIYLIRFKRSPKSIAFAGAVMSLSYYTKQTALFISLPLMLYVIVEHRFRSLYFIGAVALLVGGGTLILDFVHDGWYTYYTFEVLRQHELNKGRLVTFWTEDIMSPLPIVCLFSLFYILTVFSDSRKTGLFFVLLGVAMVASSWTGRLNRGGVLNALIPAYAYLSILFGLGFDRIIKSIEKYLKDERSPVKAFVYIVCIIQFALLYYNPIQQIPTQKDLEAGYGLVETLRQIEGDVYIPSHGYLAVYAGKKSFAHTVAVNDIRGLYGGKPKKDAGELNKDLFKAIRQHRFGAIILDGRRRLFERDIRKYYRRGGPVFRQRNVFWTVTGKRTRPQIMYVPRSK